MSHRRWRRHGRQEDMNYKLRRYESLFLELPWLGDKGKIGWQRKAVLDREDRGDSRTHGRRWETRVGTRGRQ